jgi:hypothetical protein
VSNTVDALRHRGFDWHVRGRHLGYPLHAARAVRSRDALALTCGVLTALLSLIGWLMIGMRVGSMG